MSLKGKVAVVTGGNSGIGRAIVLELARQGANLVIDYIVHPEATEELEQEVLALGDQVTGVEADVSQLDGLRKMINAAVQQFGRIDILVNNAAITPDEPLLRQPAEVWDEVFAINTRGPFLLCREVIPVMKAQGGGRIINIGSTVPQRGDANRLAYGCSKGALLTMTKMLARGLVRDHILVNWVAVGWVATPGEVALRNQISGDGQAFLDEVGRKAPLGRLETVEEIAAGVAYLASEEASHITGCELNISGGLWV